MRSAPQSMLSLAIVWISAMSAGASRLGWRLGRDFCRQKILKRSRCQRSSVFGLTTCNVSRHPRLRRASTSKSRRSSRWSRGRSLLRRHTMTCCRSKAFSARSSDRVRARSPAAPATNIAPVRAGRSKRRSARPMRAGTTTVIRFKSMVALRESSGWVTSMETGLVGRSQLPLEPALLGIGCPVTGCRKRSIPTVDAKGSQDDSQNGSLTAGDHCQVAGNKNLR